MKPALFAAALLGCLGLCACAEGYGYAYDYDPYGGPSGHYVSPFGTKRARVACRTLAYTGPYEDVFRGTYYAGPYCLDGQTRLVVAQ